VRFIDLNLAAADPAVVPLIQQAETARASILRAQDDLRSTLVMTNRRVWVSFRPHFERIYGPKCWYTESQNPGTDADIDHYRPKGRLAGQTEHGGYWWEALNWRNFRLSCHHANRRRTNPDTGDVYGKGSWFPLLDEADRCELPSDNLSIERPTLLDPTNSDDTALLTFDPDGRVALVPGFAGDGDAQRRFSDSRKYLHLDWPAITEARQQLYAQIYGKVLQGDRARNRLSREDSSAREWLREIAIELITVAGHLKPYSRAAQAYIMRFRDRSWVKQMVLPYIPNPLG
jgi:hypothetical protein